MPATLQTIKGKIVELQITLDPDVPEKDRSEDDVFTVQYRAHSLNANVEAVAQRAAKDGRELEALVDMALSVLVSWDLKPGPSEDQLERLAAARDPKAASAIDAEIKATILEQEPIPITKEALMEVPASIFMLILTQIQESRNIPNPNGTARR